MRIDLEGAREVWKHHLGFMPTAIASFDHMTTGFPSRLAVGYANLARFCAEHELDEFRAVSVVLDTVVAKREEPSGVSAELGFVPTGRTRWVKDPNAFFFGTEFCFDFDRVRPEFEEGLDAALRSVGKRQRLLRYRDAMGWYSLIQTLWRGVASPNDVVRARRDLLEVIGIRFKGKHRLHSGLSAVEADVLEYLIGLGVDLNDCPQVARTGVARLVAADGTEERVIKSWNPEILRLMRSGENKIVLTSPLAILTTSLLFPHFGRDYGMLEEIGLWLGTELPLTQAHDSWPVGTLRARRSRNSSESFQGLWTDLFFWGRQESYAELIQRAIETKGSVFDARLCDWPT